VPEPAGIAPRRSKLVRAGLVLLIASFLLPQVVFRMANRIQAYGPRLAVTILGDSLVACFFVGLGVLVIGLLRNRRWRIDAQRSGPA